MIKVYHNKDFIEDTYKFYKNENFTPEFTDEKFTLVAVCNIPDSRYGDAFRLTNHIDDYWWENEEVLVVNTIDPQFRSTSVGDVFELSDGRKLVVAPVGFNEIK